MIKAAVVKKQLSTSHSLLRKNILPARNKNKIKYKCIRPAGSVIIRKRLKTTIELKRKSDFNTKAKQDNWIRTSEPRAKAWNAALSKELERAKATYRDLRSEGVATSEKVVAELQAGEKSSSFIQYARLRTQAIIDSGAIRNGKKYNGLCNKLEVFLTDKKGRKQDLTFAEVTPAFLSKFEAHLHTLPNERQPEKKLHPNTILVLFNTFKALIKRAIEVEGLMKPEKTPFLSFKYKGVKTTKEKLSEAEIELLAAYPLVEGSLMWHCRNYFLFSYYCAGIRAGDLIQLRWSNISSGGRLRYQMGKNHKNREFGMVQEAKSILAHYKKENVKPEDYIFPLLDSSAPFAKAATQEEKDTLPVQLKTKLFNQVGAKNALINKEIKKLAKLAGVEKKISMHISRHSFASRAMKRGVDSTKIKGVLAHSSLKITEGYMGDFDTSEVDEALALTFAKDSSPKAELIALLNSMSDKEITDLLQSIKK